ncbi:hypothetical protein DFH07DRAFT_764902 [Mycena maculata]|uniref:Uncharacterized protein n=1 Tax=Mycena maculata TaxID=230809 RepID=A0AAD7KCQ6_9AGAR|nr:hypothetical protein DFH07DRAFT_764902 [Mycena maculata]
MGLEDVDMIAAASASFRRSPSLMWNTYEGPAQMRLFNPALTTFSGRGMHAESPVPSLLGSSDHSASSDNSDEWLVIGVMDTASNDGSNTSEKRKRDTDEIQTDSSGHLHKRAGKEVEPGSQGPALNESTMSEICKFRYKAPQGLVRL